MDFSLVSFEPTPKTLYQYTSLNSLVAIVQSKRLWASNIRFLNDHSESLWLKQHVLEALTKRSSGSIQQARLEQIICAITNFPIQSYFVSSFTEKADDLSQWRAYCPPSLGVSIGFSSKCLREQWVANPEDEDKPFFLSANLRKMQYYSSADNQELEETIDRLLCLEAPKTIGQDFLSSMFAPEFLPSLTKIAGKLLGKAEDIASVQTLAMWTTLFSPMLKHHAFKDEAEWRKVVSKDSRLMHGQKFRQGKSTLIPYIEVLLDARFEAGAKVPQESYFIDEVVVGPTPAPEMTIEAVHALFSTYGQPEVKVRKSEVPFRSW